MIAEGVDRIVTAPHLTIVPGALLVLSVLSLNVFGEGVRDALDPRARGEDRALMSSGMARFVVRRLLSMLLVLFAVSVLVFLIFNVLPSGDPAVRMAGKIPTETQVEAIREEWGFDEPLYVQYATMMKNLFTGETDLLLHPAGRHRRNLEGAAADASRWRSARR